MQSFTLDDEVEKPNYETMCMLDLAETIEAKVVAYKKHKREQTAEERQLISSLIKLYNIRGNFIAFKTNWWS